MAPQFVKHYVKTNKNDIADAEAICEAASRPSMRFVQPRTEAQQTLAALHRVREGTVSERTGTINRIHAILLEFGISLSLGKATLRRLPDVLALTQLPPRLIAFIDRLHEHYKYPDSQVDEVEKDLTCQLHEGENAERLLSAPGIGVITASLLAAEIGNVQQFTDGRRLNQLLRQMRSHRPTQYRCCNTTVIHP